MYTSMILFALVPGLIFVLFGILIAAVIIERRNNAMDTNAPARPRTTPKDFFLHVGAMVALYICVGSLLTLLFTVINHAFPDALDGAGRYYDYYSYNSDNSTFRMSASIVIVLFPVLWLISWLLKREYAVSPERKGIALRKWLIYLTLFLAGATIVGDVVTLIYKFLGGEITARFAYKMLSTLAVSGLIFGYFFYDLKEESDRNQRMKKVFLWISAALIVVSVVLGVVVMGSPMSQRLMQFDMQKRNDLMNMQSQVLSYWQRKGEIPERLADLNDPLSSYNIVPTDPQTGVQYEYRKTAERSFEICAEFNYESTREAQMYGRGGTSAVMPIYYGDANQNWEHGKGRHCFARIIDPQLYPVYPQYDAQGRPLPTKGVPPPTVQSGGTTTLAD